jgi:aclacinomycin oxidase
VLPCGEHPAVGIGGHIQGGAFGFLCRQHGLGADYLYAVEVLCVNKNRQVEKVIATIEPSDKNRELWWAHTGGGAGNFGAVTRYWFRKAGSVTKEPSNLLPKAPSIIETIELEWQWKDINENNFRQLVDNYCNWCFNNAGPGTKTCNMYATLHLWNIMIGKIQVKSLLTELTDGVVDDFIHTLNNELGALCTIKRNKTSWVDFALNPFPDIFSGPKAAFKVKDAFLCQPFTHQQIGTIYHYLTEYKDVFGGNIGLATYGGQVNSVASDATASAQRGAILGTACAVGWLDAKDEAKSMEWVRKCYSDLYRETGGVPVPNQQTGGCIIAHPDNDIADPNWNKSGLPWHTFYYQDNYPRLQKIKATWDLLNIFRHSLSVEPD